ncbi:MAG: hypothetical protein HY231_17210 [Acidobacteria bacterium]|nr:hypothetical protein [Acidobacteriota bacterium]
MKKFCIAGWLIFALAMSVAAFDSPWRQASEKELEAVIPARAPVENERIETELRTASGVTDGHGKFIAGVVMITAGYAADGKYSHFFFNQVAIKVGETKLKIGEYVFGSKRIDDDALEVKFYEAATGKYVGSVKAVKESKRGAVRSLLIAPPENGKGVMQIGRFFFGYELQ